MRGKILNRVFTVFGILIIILSVTLVLITYIGQIKAADAAADTVEKLCSLMPEVKDSIPDDRVNMAMPVLEVDGDDFAGIIELPAYDSVLPIYGTWDSGKVASYPCRFTGSVYGGSLVIGGSDNAGQFDFMKLITGGDSVYITDVTGCRYSYTVTDVEITRDVSADNLCSDGADLTLFARNTYGFDYIVVRCVFG